jgi:molybdopterin-binding protein
MASLPYRNSRNTDITQVKGIVEGCVPARWLVVDSEGALNRVLPVLDIQILPGPPNTIDHSVVQEEERVAGRGEEVTSRVAANGEVTSGVHAEESVQEVALHPGSEPVKVLVVFDQTGDI